MQSIRLNLQTQLRHRFSRRCGLAAPDDYAGMLDEGPSGFAGGMSAKNICRSPGHRRRPRLATPKL
jgi:hypothetical protein